MVSDDDDYADLVAQYARHSPPPDPDVQDYDATIIDGSENDEWLTAAQQRRGENDSISSSGLYEIVPLSKSLNPTRRRAVCEFLCPVTVFLNKRSSGEDTTETDTRATKIVWDIDRSLCISVSCVEIPSTWDDGRQLLVTFLQTDMITSQSMSLKAPIEWSARIFLVLLAASVGDTCIKNGVISCHFDAEDPDGNDMNRIIRIYKRKHIEDVKTLTETSEYALTVFGGKFKLK